MKQLKLTFVLTVLMSMVGLQAFADWDYTKVQVDGLYYYLDNDNNHAMVTNVPDGEDKYAGDIVIPASISYNNSNYYVTEVGGGSFYNCSGIKSIKVSNEEPMPVGSSAFAGAGYYGPSNSVLLYVPKGSKENYAANNQWNIFKGIREYASDAIIDFADENVKSICVSHWDTNGDGELSENEAAAVTTISNYFANNSSITSFDEFAYFINLESLPGFYMNGFRNCKYLTSITIPYSVKTIDNDCFTDCSRLTTITVCSNDIASREYSYSYNLQTIFGSHLTECIFGDKVTSIGENALRNCSSLTSITIPNSVTSIGSYAFRGCSGLTSVTIGNSVTSIGDNAFSSCSGLTSVTIPSSVTSIGNEAFSYCSGLTSVTIPNSVTSIGNSAFYWCNGLTSVTIPNSVTSIGYSAFEGCSGLTSINVESGNTKYDSRNNCNAIIETASNKLLYGCNNTIIPNSVTSIGDNAFFGCSGLTSITIPNSVTSIGDRAFFGCTGLTSVNVESGNTVYDSRNNCNAIIETASNKLLYGCNNTIIPNSVTSIGNEAFRCCSGLTSVTIPNSVTSIGNEAFYYCSGLTSVTIGNSVTSIGNEAFYYCSGLTSVTIPNSVTSIGNSAFYGCSGLTSVTIDINTPLTINSFTFSNRANANLYVPVGHKFAYEAADYWKEFKEIVETPNIVFVDANVKAICIAHWDTNGDGKLSTDEAAAVTDLGEVFQGKTTITSFDELQYFTGLTSIGNNAFSGCSGLTSITIPSSVTTIGSYAFNACSGLTSVTSKIKTPFTFGSSAFNMISNACVLTVPYGRRAAYIAAGWTESVFKGGIVEDFPLDISDYTQEGIVKVQSNTYNIDIPIAYLAWRNNSRTAIEWCDVTIVSPSDIEYSFTRLNPWGGLQSHIVQNGDYIFFNLQEVESGNWHLRLVQSNAGEWYYCNGSIASSNINFADANVKALCVANWDTDGDGELSYDEAAAVTSLGSVFQNNTTITSFDELQYFTGLTSIGNNAFSGCSGLTLVTIPNSVTTVGQYAFSGCSGLTSVTIPNGVTSIAGWAFKGCTGLTSVTIGNSVTSIYNYPFEGCTGLQKVIVPDIAAWCGVYFSVNDCNPLNYAHHLYSDENTEITDLVIPNGVTSIGIGTFQNCSGLTSVTIPNSVTSIGSAAFWGCSGLSSITVEQGNTYYDSRDNSNAIIETESNTLIVGCKTTIIPNSVTSIGDSAFDGCSGLTSVTIPNSVTSIEGYAFKGCSGLTSVTIPNSVTSIGYRAFYGCTSLTSISIPNSVTSIGNYAFTYCLGLTSVISKIETPFAFGIGAFTDVSSTCVLTVPKGTRDAYIAAGWTESVFKGGVVEESDDIIVFADANVKALCVANWDTDGDGELSYDEAEAVTSIGTVFRNNTSITSFDELQYFTGLTSIGSEAFYHCSGLTSVTIPNSVTTIENNAFTGCSGLTSITIPRSVNMLEGSPFRACTNLETIIVEEGNTSFDSRDNCNAIIDKSVNRLILGCKNTIIPNSITSIGMSSFFNCPGLTSITIPGNVNRIGDYAFSSCSGLTTITISNGVTSIGRFAFENCSSLTSIKSKIETPFAFEEYAFDNIPNTCVLTVPKGTRDAYIAAGWTEDVFKGGVVEDENITIAMKTGSGADRTMIGYSSQYNLDFTGINDVRAYIAIGFTDTKSVLMARVYVVPANTGIVLKSDVAGVEVEVPTTTSDVYYANLLKPAVKNVTIYPTEDIAAVNYTNLMVGKLANEQMGFVTLTSSKAYSNKCYLQVPTAFYNGAASAREGGLEMEFVDTETTDIRSLMHNGSATNDAYYDLQGRKVTTVKKGIYIKNGKKVIVK